ncbi:MAG: NTP transferase domain-containing protein [Lachnospiraceae bacterium]|nr:NTP transferase domain-containing protein [Lachnospiraceae bacterium]
MRKIDKNVRGILFITDEDHHLLGSLTDGDIRRCIIRNGNLQQKASEAMLSRTRYITVNSEEDPYQYMEREMIHALPVLDAHGRIVDIIFQEEQQWREADRTALKGVPVVIMAGGQGTRLYPYTKILPKALIPIREKTISEHIIESFLFFGCRDYYFILNHKKNMIKAYFSEMPHDYELTYIEEEKALGTGGGVALLHGMINETFILTNCDILIREDIGKIFKHHKETGNKITMICSMKDYTLPYGVIHTGEAGSILSMEEKPQLSFLVNTGCYIVEPDVIDRIPPDTAIGFPDVIEQYRVAGERVGIYPIGENAWMDMGELDLLEKAII